MTETTIREQLEQLEYLELQARAKAAGLPATGKGPDLRESLAEHYDAKGITELPALGAAEEPETADGPQEPPVIPVGDEAGQEAAVEAASEPDVDADAEEVHTYRAVRPMMERDGRTPIRQGQLFQATASDPRTKHARRVDPEPSPEVRAALEAADTEG